MRSQIKGINQLWTHNWSSNTIVKYLLTFRESKDSNNIYLQFKHSGIHIALFPYSQILCISVGQFTVVLLMTAPIDWMGWNSKCGYCGNLCGGLMQAMASGSISGVIMYTIYVLLCRS